MIWQGLGLETIVIPNSFRKFPGKQGNGGEVTKGIREVVFLLGVRGEK